jgi:hypothetical protein
VRRPGPLIGAASIGLTLLFLLPALVSGSAGAPSAASGSPPALPPTSPALNWHNLTSNLSTSPLAMNGEQLAYNDLDQYLLLYGGYNQNGDSFASWKFTAAGWTKLFPKGSPPGVNLGVMTYDFADKEIVLYGGNENTLSNVAETTTFRSGTWRSLSPVPAPPGRANAGMAYDPVAGLTILFGGCGPPSTSGSCYILKGTYAFLGGNWSQLYPKASPPIRWDEAMAYDPALRGIVLFGGCTAVTRGTCTATASDTWLYKGGNWSKLTTKGDPLRRYGASLTYDPKAGGMVLFGGSTLSGSVLNDTWVLKGTQWVHLIPKNTPPGRFRVRLAYDPTLSEVVMFAGASATGSNLRDTWVLD